MYTLREQGGFTLVEVTLSVTILLIVAAFSVPVLQSFQNSNDLNAAVATTATVLRRAQLKASAVEHDDAWGVHMTTSTVTLYRGSDFSTRDSSYDERTSIPESVGFSGLTDITYSKFTGLPLQTGTTTVQRASGEQQFIGISTLGVLNYE